jgi:hypothetical protein
MDIYTTGRMAMELFVGMKEASGIEPAKNRSDIIMTNLVCARVDRSTDGTSFPFSKDLHGQKHNWKHGYGDLWWNERRLHHRVSTEQVKNVKSDIETTN